MSIDRRDLSDIAKAVRGHVAKAIGRQGARLAELESRIENMPAGPRGERGEAGPAGPQGETGLTVIGNVGPEGPQGPQGLRGEQGEKGAPGSPGARGEPGETGPAGIAGTTGERGAPGERGEAGPRGESGLPGERGAPGERGEAGIAKDGRDGRDGKDGRDGDPGRDALELNMLDSVDETRSYPRGTWACLNGGIARFDGVAWRSMVRGIAADVISIDENDPRSRTRKVTFSDGTFTEMTWREPIAIYRGVFRDGTEYESGDMVTRDGSVWHCEAEKTRSIPGKSDDWKLAVKRGNDGKHGADGHAGEPGPQGPAGRDLRYS